MRNWKKPHIYKYGFGGGSEFIHKEFNVDPNHPKYRELTKTRQVIATAFHPTDCFLLPPQGKSVQFISYEGQWRHLDPDLKRELVIFIENVLNPSNLVTKKINGKELNTIEFLQVVKEYAKKMDKDNEN